MSRRQTLTLLLTEFLVPLYSAENDFENDFGRFCV